MIILLILSTAFSWLRVGAMPISAGPITDPTLIHAFVFGVHARNSCSDMRSMYDILRSCFFTIAACVYRAVHPNIPNPALGFWGRLGVTLKITFYALMAPELIILWALRQRFAAKYLANQMNEIMEGMVKLKPELRWTQTHGQFMQMGGIARKDNKAVLQPAEIQELLQNGLISVEDLYLTQKEINDKSKGDILSKGLVAFQTTWFIFECITRLQQGLPLIELEVITLAFATLNAITYALWWHKPLNVICPIYIPIRSPSPPLPPTLPNSAEAESQPQDDDIAAPAPVTEGIMRQDSDSQIDQSRMKKVGIVEKGKALAQAFWGRVKHMAAVIKNEVDDSGYWSTAWTWLIAKPIDGMAGPIARLGFDDRQFDPDQTTYVATFSSMYETTLKPSEQGGTSDLVLGASVGMIFGAIHFISWNAKFPTHAHLVLWRASCIVLVVQPFIVNLFSLFGSLAGPSQSGFVLLLAIIFAILMFTGPTPYILARLCVLVLAFLTLHDLPPDAFVNITWTSYIPHF